MLEQISRISQQIGYYLHRASMRSGGTLLSRELQLSALNKVYQRKGDRSRRAERFYGSDG